MVSVQRERTGQDRVSKHGDGAVHQPQWRSSSGTHVSQLPFTQPAFNQRPESQTPPSAPERATFLLVHILPRAHTVCVLHNSLSHSPAMATNPNACVLCSRGIWGCGLGSRLTRQQHQRQRSGPDHPREQAAGCLHHSRSMSRPYNATDAPAPPYPASVACPKKHPILMPAAGTKPHRFAPDCRRWFAV